MHLQEITQLFAHGDFEKPLMTHGERPPGVTAMQRHRNEIAYSFKPGDRGGSVRMVTANADALHALHDLLRDQIREHATGDPVVVLTNVLPGAGDPAPGAPLALSTYFVARFRWY